MSLVIPVYEERESIERLVEEIEQVRGKLPVRLETILVDDGSKDGTWDRICELKKGRDWLLALRFLGNQGQTAAIAAGLEASRGELVAFMDADLQNDPGDLPRMLEPILSDRADGVCGWRENRKDNPISRTLPSRIANALIGLSLGLRLHDVGCTLKVFRRVYLDDVHLVGEMHRFIPAYAHAQGARIVEMPVNHRERKYGRSKYGLTRIYKVLIDLLTVKMINAYGTKPAYFFGKIGLGFFGMGSVAFSIVAYRVFVLGRPQSTPMIFFMLLLFIAALICFMSGLQAELTIRILHTAGGRRSYKVIDRLGFPSRRESSE